MAIIDINGLKFSIRLAAEAFVEEAIDFLQREITENLLTGYEKFAGHPDYEWEKISEKREKQLGIASSLSKKGMSAAEILTAVSNEEEHDQKHLIETLKSSLNTTVFSDFQEGSVTIGSEELKYAPILETGGTYFIDEKAARGKRTATIPKRPFFKPAIDALVKMAPEMLERVIKEKLQFETVKVRL